MQSVAHLIQKTQTQREEERAKREEGIAHLRKAMGGSHPPADEQDPLHIGGDRLVEAGASSAATVPAPASNDDDGGFNPATLISTKHGTYAKSLKNGVNCCHSLEEIGAYIKELHEFNGPVGPIEPSKQIPYNNMTDYIQTLYGSTDSEYSAFQFESRGLSYRKTVAAALETCPPGYMVSMASSRPPPRHMLKEDAVPKSQQVEGAA